MKERMGNEPRLDNPFGRAPREPTWEESRMLLFSKLNEMVNGMGRMNSEMTRMRETMIANASAAHERAKIYGAIYGGLFGLLTLIVGKVVGYLFHK